MNNKEKKFISVVVYVYNDEEYLKTFINMIHNVFCANFENTEMIFVNDASNDNTVQLIKNFFKGKTEISQTIVNMSYYHGVEQSMNAGVDIAIGDYVFEFDSIIVDYNENTIIDIYRKLLEGYDIVSAIPSNKTKFASKVFYNILKKFGNYKYKLETDRFRVLSRRLINRIHDYNKAVFYRKVIYEDSGLGGYKLYYDIVPGVQKKDSNKYKLELAIDSLLVFTNVGFVICSVITIGVMILMLLTVIYALLFKLLNKPVAGWTSTVIFISIGFFCLFAILTIVVKYLQLLIDLQVKRKKYNYNSIEKIN